MKRRLVSFHRQTFVFGKTQKEEKGKKQNDLASYPGTGCRAHTSLFMPTFFLSASWGDCRGPHRACCCCCCWEYKYKYQQRVLKQAGSVRNSCQAKIHLFTPPRSRPNSGHKNTCVLISYSLQSLTFLLEK